MSCKVASRKSQVARCRFPVASSQQDARHTPVGTFAALGEQFDDMSKLGISRFSIQGDPEEAGALIDALAG